MKRKRRPCLIVEIEGQTYTESYHDGAWRVLRSGALLVTGRAGEDRVREASVYRPGSWLLRIIALENCGLCGEG